ncbi:MAG: PD-(D/E)XK nuclease family protein [Rhodospirillales bacterium]
MPFDNNSEFGPWIRNGIPDVSPSRLRTAKDCLQKYEYQYVKKLARTTGAPALQGTSLHQVFLEEYLGGGVDNVEFLLEMMADDLRHRLDTEDPRDWKSGLPLNQAEKFDAISDLKVWAEGLLEAVKNGEDTYGNPLVLPATEKTEVEACVELTLPRLEAQIRLRGFVDLVFEDGSVGDLKLASDYWKSIWTLGKAITEDQPAMYAKMMGTNKFRYLIVDKRKDRAKRAAPPSVRTIDFEVTDRDFERLIEDLEWFVQTVDLLNDHKNGRFPPRPEYNGQTKATAGKPEEQFCGKLCDFKAQCYKDNFARNGGALDA